VLAVGLEDDHPHLGVLGRQPPGLVEIVEQFERLRVRRLRPVERDGAILSATEDSMDPVVTGVPLSESVTLTVRV
jgi:hypothetical protein